MTLDLLLVSHQKDYRQLLKDGVKKKEFGKAGRVKIGPTSAATALKQMAAWSKETVLVLDAELPSTASGQPDKAEYKPALEILNKRPLSDDGRPVPPAIVIVPRTIPMSEIDNYCNWENRAIALPLNHLSDGNVLKAFVTMLSSLPAWTVVELDVDSRYAHCQFKGVDGQPIVWGSASLENYVSPRELADQFANFQLSPGWAKQLHDAGKQVFSSLLLPVIGAGLFSHLEHSAGGLGKLAFRFRVDQPELYTAPFEATVRRSRQDAANFANQLTYHPFMLLHAPITRRAHFNPKRSVALTPRPEQPRMLFIRAQPGEHPGAETESDLLMLESTDPNTRATKKVQRQFDRLKNIDQERDLLEQLHGVTIEKLDLSVGRGKAKASKTLENFLKGKSFDVIHFAGHSLTWEGFTMLVLPGEESGQAEAMAAETFASLASKAGARLVYLSSCEGSSASAVTAFAQYDIPCVLGFRWVVNDASAANFAKAFYEALFHDRKTICLALREACSGAYKPEKVESSAIWASPILASQWDDWSTRAL